MKAKEVWSKEKAKGMAKKAVSNSVGKCFWPYSHERKAPESVKEWVKESKRDM